MLPAFKMDWMALDVLHNRLSDAPLPEGWQVAENPENRSTFFVEFDWIAALLPFSISAQ